MPRREDLEVSRLVRKELARRPIDTQLVNVQIYHGVVYLRGTVRAMRGHAMDLRQEMELISRILKQKPGIRDVVLDLTYRG